MKETVCSLVLCPPVESLSRALPVTHGQKHAGSGEIAYQKMQQYGDPKSHDPLKQIPSHGNGGRTEDIPPHPAALDPVHMSPCQSNKTETQAMIGEGLQYGTVQKLRSRYRLIDPCGKEHQKASQHRAREHGPP